MNSQIERLIAVAEKYIGVKESPPNSNNVLFNTWYYGGPVNGSNLAWCMVFVGYVFNESGLSHLLYDGKTTLKKGGTASCTTLMNWAKQKGMFHTSGLQRGDVVLFNWSGAKSPAQHVGIITGLGSGGVQTIEGNTAVGNDSNGGEVMRRTRTYGTIIGAFRPNYEEDEDMLSYEDWKKYMEQYRAELAKGTASLAEFQSAKSRGITDGTRPKDFVTREEAAVMAVRAAK